MLKVASRSGDEGLVAAGPGVEVEIVQLENLLKVRVVMLSRLCCEIAENVVHRSERSAVVKGAVPMRYHKDDGPGWPHDSRPSMKSLEGIRDVLQDMGGQEKVV